MLKGELMMQLTTHSPHGRRGPGSLSLPSCTLSFHCVLAPCVLLLFHAHAKLVAASGLDSCCYLYMNAFLATLSGYSLMTQLNCCLLEKAFPDNPI